MGENRQQVNHDQFDGGWLTAVIDWGHSQGITKRDLLENYYPDEIADLMTLAKKREQSRRAFDYMMSLRFSLAPWVEPGDREQLIKDIQKCFPLEETQSKQGYTPPDSRLDREALGALKEEMERRKKAKAR
ncbi:MAG: hypothetical protein ACOY9Y_09715 [Bacillota bacterium]